MADRAQPAEPWRRGLFDALLAAARTHGAKKPILEDQERRPLAYLDLIRASFALGRKLAAMTAKGERVGIMLPSSAGASVTFFALQAFGRVPAMLNFTAGIRNLKAAQSLAGIKIVLTSHRFVEQGKLHDQIDALEGASRIVYLEDVRRQIGLGDRLYALAAAATPARFRSAVDPDDPAVILFTSGSFGAPRGVALSHANILSNVDQVARHIALDPAWVMFNPLPVFHCFGLTGGLMLPLVCGLKAFQYPSPLHFKLIPPLL
ncbi:MAG: AMP-binding protein, partial [Caulobacteraceae bacterium]